MNILVITGGTINDYALTKNLIGAYDYVICADGGLRHIAHLDIKPNQVVGDFDSADKQHIQYVIDEGIDIVKYPAKKDMTDTEIAIDAAIDYGADKIIVVGAIGSRMDHTLANVHILYRALKFGIECIMVNENNKIKLIDGYVDIDNDFGKYLSLIPMTTQVKGITTEGLMYPLKNATISIGTSYGISNEILGPRASVDIKSGILIMIQSKD